MGTKSFLKNWDATGTCESVGPLVTLLLSSLDMDEVESLSDSLLDGWLAFSEVKTSVSQADVAESVADAGRNSSRTRV